MLVPVHVVNRLENSGRAEVQKSFELIRNHFGILFYCLIIGWQLPSLARWFEAALLTLESYQLLFGGGWFVGPC